MRNKLNFGPILASVLVLTCTGGASAVDLSTIFNDHVNITTPGYSGGTNIMRDFPLLVKISESNPQGFKYSRTLPNGADLRFSFLDQEGVVTNVPCRVDLWDTNGTSRVFVNVPKLNSSLTPTEYSLTVTKLTMYWAASDEDEIPPNDPSAVTSTNHTGRGDAWIRELTDQEDKDDYIAYNNFYTTGIGVYDGAVKRPDVKPGYSSLLDYASSVTFTVNDIGDEMVAKNFPMLIRLSNDKPKGFSYSALRGLPGGKDDIRFFDDSGRSLAYDVDTWNEEGESLIWVRVPVCRTGTRITMAWGQCEGSADLPANGGSTAVWGDYVGVWHMSETIGRDQAPTAVSTDFTGHGLHAVPKYQPHNGTATGNLSQMVSTRGVFGNARVNATECKQWGNHLEVPSYRRYGIGSTFTVSFWVQIDNLKNYPQLVCRKLSTTSGEGWHIESRGANRKELTIRGDGGNTPNATIATFDGSPIGTKQYYNIVAVFDGSKVTVYRDGKLRGSGTINAATENDLPMTIGCGHFAEWKANDDFTSVAGSYDEFRLSKGVRSAENIAMDYAQSQSGFYTAGTVTNNASAVYKNWWDVKPSISRYDFDIDEPPSWDDIDLGVAHGGRVGVTFYNRRTGECLGANLPSLPGDYRAVFSTEGTDAWGPLEYTLNFRIVRNEGSYDLGLNGDRVLLLNDDLSIEGAEVAGQCYDDERYGDSWPYWTHYDAEGFDASTGDDIVSTSLDFNFGGGVRHLYHTAGGKLLWELRDVRIGNTFDNWADVLNREGRFEQYDEGLWSNQNYLPWNPLAGGVVGTLGADAIEGYHAFAGQVILRNSTKAQVTSSCFTNGVGTVYFDAVNGWTDNIFNDQGKGNYRLVVEVSTNTVLDALGERHPPYDEYVSSNPDRYCDDAFDPFYYAEWKAVPFTVLRFDGEECSNLGSMSELTMDVTTGGSYGSFYRIVAPIGVTVPCRIRIRRTAIDPKYSLTPDGPALILLDNLICSTTAEKTTLSPYGHYDKNKIGDQVQGYEAAFIPAFPTVQDTAIYGRARATMPDGSAPPAGRITAATMHYRWHCIEQKTTDWLVADMDPTTLTTIRPLEMPQYRGDFDFWFECNQSGGFYRYADYSGTGLELGDLRYTEAISSVTNRAARWQTKGDWFVRTRDGKSDYAEVKLLVKTSASTNETPVEIGMVLTGDGTWRGFYQMTSEIADGIRWRIEARDPQTSGSKVWTAQTNRWYVTDWTSQLPDFPATGRMSVGGESSWSRMPCDMQTGYLMFQIDETTLGVTVIHADYQNFNNWNDSASGYFVGSSNADTNGTSAYVQLYDQKYEGWADTVATDVRWSLEFEGKMGDKDHPEDVPFPSKPGHYSAWDLGKGQWAYGHYREPNSGVSFQMFGCGEGYLEFSDSSMVGGAWPRGLESIDFKARVAQPVEPDRFAYYGPGWSMTNYTFYAYSCFDMKGNEGFSGNASLSLLAYFRDGEGGYEARWEQVSGETTTNPSYSESYIGPAPQGQRLVIYRWDSDGNEYVKTQLGMVTNSAWATPRPMPIMTGSATNNFMPMCISVFEDGADTVIVAGVMIDSDRATDSGVQRSTTIQSIGADNWYFLVARDGSTNRKRGGSYGLLTANCEGQFYRPQIRLEPTWPEGESPALKAGKYSKKGLSVSTVTGLKDCLEEIRNGMWSYKRGRMERFWNDKVTGHFGFTYVKPSQVIKVQLADMGTQNWQTLDEITIDGFGTPQHDPDYERSYYSPSDKALRLVTGGTLGGFRTDVVIDDIVQRQWRGYADWSSRSKESDVVRERYGRTNIVFTSGWINNDSVQLNARRTDIGTPASIRSPLLDGQGNPRRGVGLGMIGFEYRLPHRGIMPSDTTMFLVQIATNNVSESTLKTFTLAPDSYADWITVTNITYDALIENYDRKESLGRWTSYFGLHGAKGLMRVVMPDELIQYAQTLAEPEDFPYIEITQAWCKNEPALDKGCWWGWNMQAMGDAYDSSRRMYLADCGYDASLAGKSMALNNSVRDGVGPDEDLETIKEHMPFLQSPTFTNAIIGQVSFKARKFELSDQTCDAEITIYATKRNPDAIEDADWVAVETFLVTNTYYETFTCKTDPGNDYRSFRFGVTGVDGVHPTPGPKPASGTPVRVMLDEVTVSEPVRAMLSFRHVGAFRTDLATNCVVQGVTTSVQQPLCEENWGIQAEVFATMLGNEIDLSYVPKVKLHWYVGKEPWGYSNWKGIESGSAYLAQAEGSNLVYRSSYSDAPAAVMTAQHEPNTVVQYMLEVEYKTLNIVKGEVHELITTNWLDSASWTVPEWYAPLDFNNDPEYGAGKSFAAFNILDTVAPGWAWINEMNFCGNKVGSKDSDRGFQYLEVCVPAEADLTGWRVRMLEAGVYNDTVLTNWVARFGQGQLSGHKTDNRGMAQRKVFRSIGNTVSEKLKYENGTLDGIWTFGSKSDIFKYDSSAQMYYIADVEMPFGVQLVRPSGIIEHSIVVVGTNRWGALPAYREYDPTNIVAKLNQNVPGSRFFYAAEDCAGSGRSASVTKGRGATQDTWVNDWACSPGYINTNYIGSVQNIDPFHPTPSGDSIVIYASVDTSNGPITQRIGDKGEPTTANAIIILPRGDTTGTNIVYEVAPWYELKSVTTNGIPEWSYVPQARTYRATLGVNASNDISVVATAQVDSELARTYGLTPDNPYTPAVMNWLLGGSTLNGPFANNGVIAPLAKYVDMQGVVITNLTLTQMYCLDMDPTTSNLIFQAGMDDGYRPVAGTADDGTDLVNAKMRVFMMISNRSENAASPVAWSPYVLRGLTPGETSLDYEDIGVVAHNWTSATFKVTGILNNGLTSRDNPAHWVPLRWFVFHRDSFYQEDDDQGHKRFTTEIEVVDPLSAESPAAAYGWYRWCQEHETRPTFYNSWAIDMTTTAVGIEVLHEENFLKKKTE